MMYINKLNWREMTRTMFGRMRRTSTIGLVFSDIPEILRQIDVATLLSQTAHLHNLCTSLRQSLNFVYIHICMYVALLHCFSGYVCMCTIIFKD